MDEMKPIPRSFAASLVQDQLKDQVGNVGNLTPFSIKQIGFYVNYVMKIKNYTLHVDVRDELNRQILIAVRNEDGKIKKMSKAKNTELRKVNELTGLVDYNLRFADPEDAKLFVTTTEAESKE